MKVLKRVTEEHAWHSWILYMLEAIEVTASETQERVSRIIKAIEKAQKLVQQKAPKIYSKDLIEIIFQHPYCKIRFLEAAGLAKRQTAAIYLQTLEEIGLLKSVKVGLEKYYINFDLIKILGN